MARPISAAGTPAPPVQCSARLGGAGTSPSPSSPNRRFRILSSLLGLDDNTCSRENQEIESGVRVRWAMLRSELTEGQSRVTLISMSWLLENGVWWLRHQLARPICTAAPEDAPRGILIGVWPTPSRSTEQKILRPRAPRVVSYVLVSPLSNVGTPVLT